ncbi:putative tfiih and nucleotide excision repair factor 3 complexes subunit [Phaeomoniella chlamydospora]|uniref:RNA polymerase II transcription factor B subunit 2 n=1 Tax=Phaeomoniella chlamydospora TaxID=158046 RepID=A0A0G2EQ86_PHACM|nr:putative tfiih and nucleotide excision repair factor 3 complexes subunit [Phaeomoniella chlamydospora]
MADSILQSWEYLETLPGTEFFRLYQHPSSVLAIFRKRLTDLAKTFVMALLYMPVPLPVVNLEAWVKPESTGEKDFAIDLLHRYHIFQTSNVAGQRSYSITENFANSLKQALTGGGEHESFGAVATTAEAEGIDVADLDNFARNQWEGILGYMVGNSSLPLETTAVQPSNAVKELLRAGHLIEIGSDRQPRITKEGFAFVLHDVNTQVWALLFLYVDNAEYLGMSKVEVLSFLFMVASLELGLAYSKQNLSQTRLSILSDLADFGIVYQKSSSAHFFPTRLAVTLTSDSASALASVSASLSSSLRPSSSNTGGKGFIIIETNYRVYAYTSSPLQIALLGLFVNLRSRHPNLVTGKMSKRSVQRAVQNGITADQIISYLSSHAHPQMRRAAVAAAASATNSATDHTTSSSHLSIIPGTIIDQINLWQLERDRMTATSGYLFKDFDTQAAFDGPCQYADSMGVLVWKDEKKRMFFVSRMDVIAHYMRNNRGGGDDKG